MCTVAAHLQTVRRHHARQLRRARESLDIFAPVAAQLSMDTIKAELETLAYATMKRNRHAHSASGRLLVAMAALLAAEIRAFSVPAGHAWSCKLAEPIAMRRAGSAVV